jgi:hypothetical protein
LFPIGILSMVRLFKEVIFCMIALCWLGGCASSHISPKPAIGIHCPQIRGTCIARYSYQNTSLYVTRQGHFFHPCLQSLEIESDEPGGKLLRQLNNGNYSIQDHSKNSIQDTHLDKMLSMAVFYGMTWGLQLLPEPRQVSEEAVKIEGQWYIASVSSLGQVKITLLKSNDTGVNSLVQFQDEKGNFLAKSYNFRLNKDLHKNIPYTIDVFDITRGLSSKQLVLQVQYIDLEVRD